jgi:hypothetical protein
LGRPRWLDEASDFASNGAGGVPVRVEKEMAHSSSW